MAPNLSAWIKWFKTNKKLENNQKKPEEQFLDNLALAKLLNISRRTLQSWRNEGKISFSQIGSKIFYRRSDLQKLLDANYRKAFNPKKRNF
jgi:excisionase family DNA binding protein